MSKLKLERTIASYEGMVPEAVAAGSHAQILFALRDARKDILALSSALNTRPVPAPCDELVTAIQRGKWRANGEQYYRYYRDSDSGYDPEKYEEQELVTRQNAEEVIAAKDARIAGLEAERDHWKANHDCVLGKYRLVTQRPDLPVDRLPAIRKLEALEADNKRLREALAEYIEARDEYEKATAPSEDFGTPTRLNYFHPIGIWYRAARAALGEVKS